MQLKHVWVTWTYSQNTDFSLNHYWKYNPKNLILNAVEDSTLAPKKNQQLEQSVLG